MDPITPRAPRARAYESNANTPQRRSLYDLQKLIDEVFDGFARDGSPTTTSTHGEDAGERTCRAKDLPAILSAFEERRKVMLLDENEMEMLKAFTEQHPDLDVSSEQLVSLLSAMTAETRSAPSSPTRGAAYDKQLPTPPPSDAEAELDEGEDSTSNLSPEVLKSTTTTSRSRTSSSSGHSSSSSHNSSTMLTGSGTLEDTILTSPSLFDTDPIFPRSQSMPDGVLLQQLIPSPPGTPIPSSNIHQRSHTSGDLARVAGGASGGSGHGEMGSSSIPRPISSLQQHGRSKTGAVLQTTPISAAIAASRQRSSPLVDIQSEHALRRSRPAPPKSRRISGDRFGSNSPLPTSSSTGSIASLDGNGRRSRQSSGEEMLFGTGGGNLVSPRMMSPNEGITSPLFTSTLDSMHEEGDSSFDNDDVYRSRSRQASNGSNVGRGASPLFDTSPPPPPHSSSLQGTMFPPQSPLLDDTSFHTIPISPHELKQAMHDFASDFDNDDDDGEKRHMLHTRPVSTISIGSSGAEIASLQELIQSLQQELSKKNQVLEALKNDSYASLMEKESLLEELRLELGSKRKEEKELRSKEKINLNMIATLEGQTATFRDERDKQKIAYQNARKQYEEQCSESEKLRNTIRSKDEDLRLADENLSNANSDLAKITRERDYLQSQVTRLEGELAEAKQSIEQLEESKNENLQLKETIDRLRLDLDELRAQAKINAELANSENGAGGTALSRSTSGTESVPATLSRNLGRELARRFAGDENEEIDEKGEKKDNDEVEDGYEEEEIVTTRRRLKRPVGKKSESGAIGTDSATSSSQEHLSLEVCDAQIQVSPPEIPTSEHATQTEKERELSHEEKRAALARDLAVNLDAVEEYVRAKEERARIAVAEPDTAPPPYQSGPTSASRHGRFQPYTTVLSREARTLLDLALQSSGSILAYTLIVFLSGILTGSTLVPVRHHHHIASVESYANWAAYNTLDSGQVGNSAGWQENAWFVIERIIWKGVAISRRVPT